MAIEDLDERKIKQMKRKVTIEFEVDPKEFHRARDTAEGTIALVKDMLQNNCDFPAGEKAIIKCEAAEEEFELE